MGYEISYGEREKSHVPWLMVGAFGAFALLVFACWPQGRAVLAKVLFPGDRAVTAQALTQLSQELRAGTELMDAVETFCCRIFAHAVAAG